MQRTPGSNSCQRVHVFADRPRTRWPMQWWLRKSRFLEVRMHAPVVPRRRGSARVNAQFRPFCSLPTGECSNPPACPRRAGSSWGRSTSLEAGPTETQRLPFSIRLPAGRRSPKKLPRHCGHPPECLGVVASVGFDPDRNIASQAFRGVRKRVRSQSLGRRRLDRSEEELCCRALQSKPIRLYIRVCLGRDWRVENPPSNAKAPTANLTFLSTGRSINGGDAHEPH